MRQKRKRKSLDLGFNFLLKNDIIVHTICVKVSLIQILLKIYIFWEHFVVTGRKKTDKVQSFSEETVDAADH